MEYNPDTSQGKIVLLPCDAPEWSNFTGFFAEYFEQPVLKKHISTPYAHESKNFDDYYTPSLFEQESPQFDNKATRVKGKIFVLKKDGTGAGDFHSSPLW